MSSKIPLDQIGATMHQLVPLVSTLNLEYREVSPERTVVHLPDAEQNRNHVGGPHAAVMFAAAESATGAAALATFSDLLGEATLLPVTATIDFLSIALGPLTATAKLNGNEAEIRAELAAGKRPEFEVVSEITNAEGKVTGRVRTVWTLKPNRKA